MKVCLQKAEIPTICYLLKYLTSRGLQAKEPRVTHLYALSEGAASGVFYIQYTSKEIAVAVVVLASAGKVPTVDIYTYIYVYA